jgi:sugar lactone lactonase YvrE
MRPFAALFSTLLLTLYTPGCGDDGAIDDDTGPPTDSGRDAPIDSSMIDSAVLDTAFGDSSLDAPGDTALPPPRDPFDGIGAVEMVQGGFSFIEGPHWRAADGVLLFTDIPATTIHRLSPPSTIDVFRTPSDSANGLGTDGAGLLLAAEHGARRVSRTLSDGSVESVATSYMGDQLNSPNDLAVRSDGTIYFTDPPYGLAGRPREVAFNGVYRVAPDGSLTAEWMGPAASRPNGISLSPDQGVLYVADTAGGLVRAYDVAADGSLSGEREFVTDTPGADGMAVDETGNLYVTTANGVQVYSSDGTSWGTIDVPMVPANCAFGDDDYQTLYITARSTLYRVRISIRGLP